MSRRQVLQMAGGGVAVAAGVATLYVGLSHLAAPKRNPVAPPPGGYPDGQYQILDYGVRILPDAESAVPVIVPPRWNLVLTARLARAPGAREQQRLAAALAAVEAAYPYSPAGVFALVGYGLPYFRAHIPAAVFDAHLPHLADASADPVLLDAIRFASDPPSLALEVNDVVFHLRSDALANLHDVQQAFFGHSGKLAGQSAPDANLSDLFHLTSVRTGFVGAGLPRQMAQQAGIAVAGRIPAAAPLFMGFTSTQHLGQAQEETVRFDGKPDPLLPPLTTARVGGYFAGGTALHLSHLREDLEGWYALDYDARVARMFHLGATTVPGRITVQTFWLNPNTTEADAQQHRLIGHNEAVQLGSRTPEGQPLQLRVDFNTLDPLDAAPGTAPAMGTPGVHFLAFTAGSSIFHQSRQQMDAAALTQRYGVAPGANGINGFIQATRRQNFLVPPRRHRAFPLLELRP